MVGGQYFIFLECYPVVAATYLAGFATAIHGTEHLDAVRHRCRIADIHCGGALHRGADTKATAIHTKEQLVASNGRPYRSGRCHYCGLSFCPSRFHGLFCGSIADKTALHVHQRIATYRTLVATTVHRPHIALIHIHRSIRKSRVGSNVGHIAAAIDVAMDVRPMVRNVFTSGNGLFTNVQRRIASHLGKVATTKHRTHHHCIASDGQLSLISLAHTHSIQIFRSINQEPSI